MNQSKKFPGKILIISGFSGAGKGTLVKMLMGAHPDEFALSISNTTRQPRATETPGVDYHFITQDEFDELYYNNGFLECARYVNKSYGTPRAFVEENLAAGRTVILEIELQGARIIKEEFPDAVMVFVTAPSAQNIFDRLVGRGTEAESLILDRMTRAIVEADGVKEYDYLLVNDVKEEAVERLYGMLTTEDYAKIGEADLLLVENIKQGLIHFLDTKKSETK